MYILKKIYRCILNYIRKIKLILQLIIYLLIGNIGLTAMESDSLTRCPNPKKRPTLLPLLETSWGDNANYEKQLQAATLAILGEHSRAEELYDSQARQAAESLKSDGDTGAPLAPGRLNAISALDAIAEAAEGHRVVMLNEAHHLSRHRLFAAQLVERLATQGFTIFAAEAFHQDQIDELIARGYPSVEDGLYLADPEYGILIRKAISKGFTLAAYEQTTEQEAVCEKTCTPEESIDIREEAQARNLASLLDRYPNSRIFVYAGFSHIRERSPEKPNVNVKWMASRFREITGVDPLTIDQVGGTPRTQRTLTDQIARNLTELKSPKSFGSLVWFDVDDKAIVSSNYSGSVDMSVFHDATTIIQGRSHWLSENRQPVELKKGELPDDRPILVKAFISSEGCDAVPVDQFLLDNTPSQKVLFLPRGKFMIEYEARNSAGRISAVEIK